MKPLAVVDASDVHAVMAALESALFHAGPALFPKGPRPTAPLPDEVGEEVAVVVETSGSTGNPKRVWLTAESLLWSAQSSVALAGEPGTWWLTLPTHYIAGLQVLVRSLVSKTSPILAPPSQDVVTALIEAGPSLQQAGEAGALYTSVVPRQLAKLLDVAESDPRVAELLRSFSRILLGGQAAPPSLVQRAHDRGILVTKTYGSAETAGGCVWDGVPWPGVTLAIIENRVNISGPMLAGGYLGDEARSAEYFFVRDGARWFRTDDLGIIDAGQLRISGRADDVIISGGVKVSLAEIERVVREHGAGPDAVVVPVDDAEWGQVPVVVSTLAAPLRGLRLGVAEVLGDAARPARVVVIDQMPYLPSGKIDRQAVLERVLGQPY